MTLGNDLQSSQKFEIGLFLVFGIPLSILGIACIAIIILGSYIIGGATLLYCKLFVPKLQLPPPGKGKTRKRRILLVTDTSQTQICGVLRKFNEMQPLLRAKGHVVETIQTDMFVSFALPKWDDVRIAVPTPWMIYKCARVFAAFEPDLVNLMTEGNCGLVTRILCQLSGIPFTTMWCSRYDLYAGASLGETFASLVLYFLKWFHGAAALVITPSPSIGRELVSSGCVAADKCCPIMNGCNTSAFTPDGPHLDEMASLKRPIWLYVGRVSHEKNVLSFLELKGRLPGSFAIVGKGTYYQEAFEKFGGDDVSFLGWRQGDELAAAYRSADVFVFPSTTDTFGQVQVEAMASGLPVAAFPVTGPIDVVVEGTGAVDDDLYTACKKALAEKNTEKVLAHARSFSWISMTERFLEVHENIG